MHSIPAVRLSPKLPAFSLNSASVRRPLYELTAAAQAAGFKGIELWTGDIEREQGADAVAEILRTHELSISAFQLLRDFEGSAGSARKSAFERAECLMSEMQAVGAETLLLCANTSVNCSGDQSEILRDLRQLAEMSASRAIRIAFEPLAWSRWLNTYEKLAVCVETADQPALGIAIDTLHWFWGGTPVAFADKIPLHKCFNVQLCDAEPSDRSALEVARHHRLFPGDGVWPVRELVSKLISRGYDGFFNLEIFNDAYQDLAATDFAERAALSVNALFEVP